MIEQLYRMEGGDERHLMVGGSCAYKKWLRWVSPYLMHTSITSNPLNIVLTQNGSYLNVSIQIATNYWYQDVYTDIKQHYNICSLSRGAGLSNKYYKQMEFSCNHTTLTTQLPMRCTHVCCPNVPAMMKVS